MAQLLHDGLLPPLDAAPPASVRLAADGSFAALVPAGRALTWQMVQDDGTPVVRERYWVTFARGRNARLHQLPRRQHHRRRRCISRRRPTHPRRCASSRVGGRTPTTAARRRRCRRRRRRCRRQRRPRRPRRRPARPQRRRRRRWSAAGSATIAPTVRSPACNCRAARSATPPAASPSPRRSGPNLMLAPARSGGTGGAVSALDAAWALQVAAGLRTFDADQTRACDVSGNGTISTLDASHILQQVVGMVARVPVAQACGADFAFVPEPAAAANQRLIMPVNGRVVVPARRGRVRAARRRRQRAELPRHRVQRLHRQLAAARGGAEPQSRAPPCGSARRPRRDSASCACRSPRPPPPRRCSSSSASIRRGCASSACARSARATGCSCARRPSKRAWCGSPPPAPPTSPACAWWRSSRRALPDASLADLRVGAVVVDEAPGRARL